ncbi:GMC oxidoreductase [Kitasatospora sp. NPDC101801]|uniref:GMC oxidoreductase n=1 Tax=Kitasatospora sp. NPDC101801 TaxID=3364103 RepID=UPI0037FE1535
MTGRRPEPPEHADVVVVGGGMAGLEIAKELDLRGAPDVLVLEAGPADDLAHVNAAHDADTALRMWLAPDGDPHFWRPWSSHCAPHYLGVAGLRRRLGGRSLYWHGVTLPVENWALREPWWPAAVVRDLTRSWQDGPSLLTRVGNDLRDWAAADGPAPAAGPDTLDLGSVRLVRAPQAVRAVPGPADHRWEAYSPLTHWEQGLDSRRTRFAADTRVLSVRLTEGQVTGVTVRSGPAGAVRTVSCRTVVLAAGTVESTRIVAQSLGRREPFDGLVDHLAQGFVVALPPDGIPAGIAAAADAGAFLYAPGPPAARSNLFVRLYRNRTGAVVLDTWLMGEQLPCADGVLRFTPDADPQAPWTTAVSCGLGPQDTEVVAAQRTALREFWEQFCLATGRTATPLGFPDFESAERILEDVLPGVDEASADAVPVTWTRPLGTEYHEAGTLPLGRWLDDGHALRGTRGLYVAGPASFPRSGAANPSLTVLALARRLAALLPLGPSEPTAPAAGAREVRP